MMTEHNDNNKIVENNSEPVDIEFEYNFLNTPWDDRTKRSKWGIVSLLVIIFVAIISCVINNFVMHYRGYNDIKKITGPEIKCLPVKIAEYNFVARIHLVSTREMLCIGALISPSSIIANGICVQSGPMQFYIGSQTNNHCDRAFSVDVIVSILHDVVATKNLVLLSSYDNMSSCAKAIGIGIHLNLNSPALIMGRPLKIGRYLSKQLVTLISKEYPYIDSSVKHLNENYLICVKDIALCPVRVGDLILQNGRLFGLAATSVYRAGGSRFACFIDLRIVHRKLKELDADIQIEDSNYENKNVHM